MDRVAADECRDLFGVVDGPNDALWSLHVGIARQVLALGGVPADELSEWIAVARSRTGGQSNGSSPALTGPPEAFSSPTEPNRPDPADLDPDFSLRPDAVNDAADESTGALE